MTNRMSCCSCFTKKQIEGRTIRLIEPKGRGENPADLARISYSDCFVGTDESLTDEQRLEQCLNLCRESISEAGLSNLSFAHVKGFALNMVVDEKYEDIEKQLIVVLREGKYDVIVWDGDNYGEKSFTRTLCAIHRALPDLQFCAFLRNCEKEKRNDGGCGFDESWKDRFKIMCFLVNDDVTGENYENLGNLALRATGAKYAYCLGGGEVVKRELVMSEEMGMGVDFIPFDAVRVRNGQVEHGSLHTST